MNQIKCNFAYLLGTAALVVAIAILYPRIQPPNPGPPPQPATPLLTRSDAPTPGPAVAEAAPFQRTVHSGAGVFRAPPGEELAASANKLDRLTQIRETFRALAAADRAAAMRAAKQISDDTERETALLTLVTEWTKGELGPPRLRAEHIEAHGLEAGLGMELANQPELAQLWANELTEGPARSAVLQEVARALVKTDPTSAFALSAQIPEDERGKFGEAILSSWAETDTGAALQWASQLPGPGARDGAIQAIRAVAPVGIGTALAIQDGYPVITQLMPGTPADLSGQLHAGDRIVAVAQGDNAYVDTHSISLADVVQMIRGAPNTTIQLQILPADAPPDSPPRMVAVVRDQIIFKR